MSFASPLFFASMKSISNQHPHCFSLSTQTGLAIFHELQHTNEMERLRQVATRQHFEWVGEEQLASLIDTEGNRYFTYSMSCVIFSYLLFKELHHFNTNTYQQYLLLINAKISWPAWAFQTSPSSSGRCWRLAPPRSLCVSQTPCTWSMWARRGWRSKCWSSRPRERHTWASLPFSLAPACCCWRLKKTGVSSCQGRAFRCIVMWRVTSVW